VNAPVPLPTGRLIGKLWVPWSVAIVSVDVAT
jgi:hypothetical protein